MSLYLCRALVPYETAAKREADGRNAFADPYAWHQRAWEAFPDRDRQQRDFLTRIDPKDEHLQLLILSRTEPARPAWCPDGNSWQVKQVPDAFFQHPAYRFSLLANPTRKDWRDKDGNPSAKRRRVPITHRDDRATESGVTQRGLLTWLEDHGKTAGFTIARDEIKTIARPRQHFTRPARGGGARVSGTLHAVDFQGELRVADPAALREAFQTGIGSAKAFGFGMLCLSPV